MTDDLILGLQVLARLMEIVGAGALVLGFVITTVRWFRDMLGDGRRQAIDHYRRALGRVVLIGLEVLVAATIIKTITVTPTLEGMGILVFMVAIRTALGWTMVLEMNGRWPWQSSRPEEANKA